MSETRPSPTAGRVVPLHPGAHATTDGAPPRRRAAQGISLAAVALAFAYGLSPLMGGLYDFTTWAPLTLLTLAVLVAALLVRVPRVGLPGTLALTGLGALAAWSALSVLWAESQENAWRETGRLGLYAATLGVSLIAVDGARRGRAALLALWTALAGTTLITAVRLVAGSAGDMFIEHRLGDPMGYVNGQAGVLLMAFWCFAAVAERARRLPLAAASAALAALCADLLLLTQARAIVPALALSVLAVVALVPGRLRRGSLLLVVAVAVTAAAPALLDVFDHTPETINVPPGSGVLRTAGFAALGTALLAGLGWGLVRHLTARRPLSTRARRGAAVALAAIPLVGLAGAVAAVDDPAGRIRAEYRQFTSLQVDQTASNRFFSGGGFRYDLWRIGWVEFRRDPLLGLGAGNYPTAFSLQRRSPQFVRQPHSLELQVLSELGVPGGVLLLLFLAGAGLAVARARTAPQRAIVVAGTGMLVVWLVHTSVDWLHLLPGVTIIALIGLALLSAAGPGAGRTSGSSGRRLALIGVLTAAALLAAAVGRLYAAELYRERAASNVAHAPREALRQSSQAIAIDGDLLEAYYVRAAALARLDDYAGARSALLSAVAREPHNYVPFALLGDLATRAGDSEAAQRYYRRADALNPYDAAHGNGLAESSR